MKPEINEQLLLRGLANNDSKAIEAIYKDNFKMVQSLIINNNGTYDDARDIFQEAMITLYDKAKSDSFVLTSQIKTYIYSVCRRLWLFLYRPGVVWNDYEPPDGLGSAIIRSSYSPGVRRAGLVGGMDTAYSRAQAKGGSAMTGTSIIRITARFGT